MCVRQTVRSLLYRRFLLRNAEVLAGDAENKPLYFIIGLCNLEAGREGRLLRRHLWVERAYFYELNAHLYLFYLWGKMSVVSNVVYVELSSEFTSVWSCRLENKQTLDKQEQN